MWKQVRKKKYLHFQVHKRLAEAAVIRIITFEIIKGTAGVLPYSLQIKIGDEISWD